MPSKPAIHEAVERFSNAIKFSTISQADHAKIQFQPFVELHSYLLQNFPEVHKNLKREIVNKYSLLFTWEGRNPALKPIILMGHLDVVPIEEGTEDNWSYPPFSGSVDETYIWGRGTVDCKVNVLGTLEAVEQLIIDGYQPQRTVYLAYGHDEEIGGYNGAAQIANLLKSRDIELDYVLDEGLAIVESMITLVSKPIALVGVAEKGFVTLELSATGKSGHSSMPPKETAIGIMASAIQKLEHNLLPAKLEGISSSMFNRLTSNMKPMMRFKFKNRWLFDRLILRQLSNNPATNAMIRTTTAATIFHAGTKVNILPHQAKAAVNFRILPGNKVEDVITHATRVVSDPRVEIKTNDTFRMEPSPISDMQSESFLSIENAILETFPSVLVSPGLVLGATDCRHYQPLSRNCYRFSPIHVTPNDLGRVHGTDERISIENYLQAVKFYRLLIEKNA